MRQLTVAKRHDGSFTTFRTRFGYVGFASNDDRTDILNLADMRDVKLCRDSSEKIPKIINILTADR